MRKGVLFSGLLHVAVILTAYFGLPVFFEPAEIQQPIPVRIVDIAEVTTPPKQEKKPAPRQQSEPPKPEPPPQAALTPPPPPAPPAPVAKPEPEPEPAPPPEPVVAPTPPAPEPEPEPEPEQEQAKPEPLPVPDRKPKPPERKVAERKPVEETPAEEERAVTDFASVLKNVEELKQQISEDAASEPEPTPEPVARERNLSEEPLTISEIDAIRAQIEQCWNVPVGARDAENLVVEIRVTLNPDGSIVAMPEILNTARMVDDPFFRAAAESAQRAVLKCSPLQMPPKKYNVWKEVTLRFDPSQMF